MDLLFNINDLLNNVSKSKEVNQSPAIISNWGVRLKLAGLFKNNNMKLDNSIIAEMAQERQSQIDKFGVQNHPCVMTDENCEKFGFSTKINRTFFHNLPTEQMAQQNCEIAFEQGYGTYAHIAVEELCEVIEAKSSEERREELIQLMTVCYAWIEKIDRENGKENHQPPDMITLSKAKELVSIAHIDGMNKGSEISGEQIKAIKDGKTFEFTAHDAAIINANYLHDTFESIVEQQ